MAKILITDPDDGIIDIGDQIGFWPDWGLYRPRTAVRARRMERPFQVDALEGALDRGIEGDYLCIGEMGEVWAMKALDFEKMYEKTEDLEGPFLPTAEIHPADVGMEEA